MGESVPVIALVIPLLMGVFGYFLFKNLLFELADEVLDVGDALIVRRGKIEERIPLTNIMNVSYSVWVSPPRVTLSLRRPGALGGEVSFAAPTPLVPFSKSKLITELIQRIDVAVQGRYMERRAA